MLPYSASAGEYRRSPSPPRAGFSSSLSPSAAPFPAAADLAPPGPGRDLPTAPSVYASAASAGDWGNASWIEPPASYMAPVTAPGAAAPGYRDRSNLLSEKHPGTCQENSDALSNGVGPSVFNQQQNSFVSKLLDHSDAQGTGPYPLQQDLNQYPFGFSYDKYATQLSSCSTDTQPHIYSTQYANSSEMAKRMAPVMNATTGESSFSSYMNPCRINLDYFGCVWNEQKDIGYQTANKQYGKWSSSLDDKAAAENYPLNPLGENCLGIDHLGNGWRRQESSETKHDLGNFISKYSSSEIGFLQPREFSSELLEVNNTFVDSPCWKGTPATYASSFSIMENRDAPHISIGTVGYNSSYQSEKATEFNFGYPAQFSECQEVSVSENDLSKGFKLPVRFENSNCLGVPSVRVYDDVAGHASYFPDKQYAGTQECYEPGEDSKNVITCQQESSCPASKAKLLDEHSGSHTGSMTEAINKKVSSPTVTTPRIHVDNLTSGNPCGKSSFAAVVKEESTQKRGEDPSQCYTGAEGNSLNISSDSSTRAIFLKLMHNLSVALLSTCKDGSVFLDDEDEILRSVIQNLTEVRSKRNKIDQKTDDGLSNPSKIKLQNIDCVSKSLWMAMHEQSIPESDLEFKTAVSKVITALPEDKVLDDNRVFEASIYKKLWIEAEASACKLKYELQLARMKHVAMKGHNNTLKDSHLLEGSKGSSSSITSNKPQNLVKESTVPLQHNGGYSGKRQSFTVNRGTLNGGDDDVFARLKDLQSRTDNVTSFGKFGCEGQQEASKKSYEVEDAVMARLEVLKSRQDNITSLSQECMPNARINRADDAVVARLGILESRPNGVTFLSQESSKQQVDAGTNREDVVDDAVMARLRILKSRPDNVTSACDVSKEHEEACVDQSNMFGVEVTPSRHIVHLENRLERNNSNSGSDFVYETCARENNASGSAVASPKTCDAPSEGMSNKDAVQGEDNLRGNRVWAQAAGDSNVCAEGSEEINLVSSPVHQHGSSSTEWEHVLKENFFHPGK